MYARFLRMMGKTAAGRVIVESTLGPAGTRLIKSLKESLTRFHGGDSVLGRDLRARILRIAWSCKEYGAALERLDATGQQRLAGPLALLVSNLVDQLRSPIMTRSPVRLTLLVTEAYNAAVNLLESVFPAEALQDLAVVYATLTDLTFAVYFLTAPEAGPERDLFSTALEEILSSHIDVAHAAAQALRRKLLRQQRTLSNLLNNPAIDEQNRLIVYLRHPSTAQHVASWLTETFGEIAARWLAFYASVDSYKQHTGSSTMSAIRADAIVDVYVRPDGDKFLALPEDIVKEIEAGVAAHVFNRRLFARAQEYIYLLANARFSPTTPSPSGSDPGMEQIVSPIPAALHGFTGSRQMKQLAREFEEVTRRLGFFAAVNQEGVRSGRASILGKDLNDLPEFCTDAPIQVDKNKSKDKEPANGQVQEVEEDEDEDEEEDDGDVLGDMHGDNTFASKLGPARVTFWAN
jgi:hypothetical protein